MIVGITHLYQERQRLEFPVAVEGGDKDRIALRS